MMMISAVGQKIEYIIRKGRFYIASRDDNYSTVERVFMEVDNYENVQFF